MKRFIGVIVVVLVGGLLTIACGEKKPAESPGTSTSETAAPTESAPPATT